MATQTNDRDGSLVPGERFAAAFDPLSRLRGEMEDLFGRYFAPMQRSAVNGDLLVTLDITESETSYDFTLDVPGIDRDDINIDVEQGRLTISGERRQETTDGDKTYRLSERSYGSFSTSFALPDGVDGDQATASLKDGVLTVSLPKSEDARKRSKKIEVKTV